MTTRILIGHVLDKLRELPAKSVHCVVTSPPYYGLRDYGIEPQVWGIPLNGCVHEWQVESVAPQSGGAGAASAKQVTNGGTQGGVQQKIDRAFCLHCGCWRGSLGLEPTLDLYLDHMVEVMRGVRRVMRKDATCWLNIGDSYSGSSIGGGAHSTLVGTHHAQRTGTKGITRYGLKPKDLMLIPVRLAIRLQEDGWWVRSDIAWCKRAPMPESATDRPTTAWEHVFLLTRSGDSTFWTHRDHEGTRIKPEPDYRYQHIDNHGKVLSEQAEMPEGWQRTWPHWRRINLWAAHDYFYDADAVKEDFADERMGADGGKAASQRNRGGRTDGFTKPSGIDPSANGGRNMRNFWLLGPEPFPNAHFATFPTEIPRRAILAGTSAKGVCPKCGAPWGRVVRRGFTPQTDVSLDRGVKGAPGQKPMDASNHWDGMPRGGNETETIGWRPTCGCAMHPAIPATVLDPFFGAGTTGLVADQLQRDCIGIDLNPRYAAMAEQRILDGSSLFATVAAEYDELRDLGVIRNADAACADND